MAYDLDLAIKERRARLRRLGEPMTQAQLEAQIQSLQERVKELQATIVEQRKAIRLFADGPAPLVADIILETLERFQISRAHFMGPQRLPLLVAARQIVSYIASEGSVSFMAIGRAMNKDHTTVLYGARMIAKRISREPALAQHISEIREGAYARQARREELRKSRQLIIEPRADSCDE